MSFSVGSFTKFDVQYNHSMEGMQLDSNRKGTEIFNEIFLKGYPRVIGLEFQGLDVLPL